MENMRSFYRRSKLPFLWIFLCVIHQPGWGLLETQTRRRPWCSTLIDYGQANEYLAESYASAGHASTPYFGESVRQESIWDARHGVLGENESDGKPPSLEYCGFSLEKQSSQVTRWDDMEQIRHIYLDEIRALVAELYPANTIRHDVFWLPKLRGEGLDLPEDTTRNTPTTGFAAAVHIDTDVRAYDGPEQFVDMLEKNRVREGRESDFPRDALVRDLRSGHRFVMINTWRNVAPTPIDRAPLAVMATRYKCGEAFPSAPDETSRWYIFSKMTRDEVLLFCQYDRNVRFPSDIWHCGLPSVGDPNAPPRSSFDVRCFLVLDEKVSPELDRLPHFRDDSSD